MLKVKRRLGEQTRRRQQQQEQEQQLQQRQITGVVPVTLSILTSSSILIKKTVTWAEAQAYCRTAYLDLATAKSQTSLQNLRDTLAKENVTGPVWMGLYSNVDTWRWSFNGRLLSNVTLRMWAAGQPDNQGGHEWCAAIDGDGMWFDTSCLHTKIFICYSANGASRYVGVTGVLNWADAQAYCRQHYTDLASAFNAADNSLVQQVATVQGFSWFGLFRDDWRWVDGTKVFPVLWQSPLPDNADPQENCGTLNGGKLDDKQCSNQYYFICDTIPVVKYVVKLQVKSDGGVFDPAVRSAILEQIKHKLDKKSTVTWRVQADGNIFHKQNSAQQVSSE